MPVLSVAMKPRARARCLSIVQIAKGLSGEAINGGN